MYEVCSNSHVTSALLERLKCRKKGNKGTPNQMACFPRTIEIQGMHAFLFDKQPSISSETTCLKKLQKTNAKRTIQSSIFDTCKLHEYKTVEVKLHMGQL